MTANPAIGSRASALGSLLRERRERLQPADVGLPAGTRRRARGLRREEVALRAAISPTYLAFLEQGRDVRPSRPVLDALAAALLLAPAERAHLHELVHGAPPVELHPFVEDVAAGVAALVDRLDPQPAYVTGRRFDVLAANRAARVMWTDWPTLAPDERNMVWWTFTDPAARRVLVEWEREASALLARYRAAADRHPGNPHFENLTARLHAVCPEIQAWWPRHDIAPLASGTKRLHHPTLGVIEFEHVVLQVADAPEQKLVTFTARPADEHRIADLLACAAGDTGATVTFPLPRKR